MRRLNCEAAAFLCLHTPSLALVELNKRQNLEGVGSNGTNLRICG